MEIKIIDIIAGARPNFMKIAPIIEAFSNLDSEVLKFRLIHTGQHYDKNMSDVFFEQLGIPKPQFNLDVRGGTQAEQTANIMVKYENILIKEKSALCIVVGDVNSTMACAITAKKFNIIVAHVEAGIRSFDLAMPEEINRLITDSISDYFFTTSESANRNLINSGINLNRIFFVGNTMIDTLLKNIKNFQKPIFWDTENLENKQYVVLTLHRPSNVDDPLNLIYLINTIGETIKSDRIIFPVHPRISSSIGEMKFNNENLILVNPLNYFEFNYLVKNARVVITDSGGVTEETTVLGVPCLTLRDTTERPETCLIGTNELVGSNPQNLIRPLKLIYKNKWKTGKTPPMWDGKSGQRIVEIIKNTILK